MKFFSEDYLQFFIDLAPNNNKDWMDENRKRYTKSVKDPFKAFVEHMILRFQEIEPDWGNEIEAKNCIFRVNRDVRFAKDKTPYKTNMSAAIAPGGKKNHKTPGIYFEFGPEFMKIYGGVIALDKEDLLEMREAIAENIKEFQKAYNSKSFTSTFGVLNGDKNKVIPKHLKDAAEKEPYIFNKNWYYFAKFDPETILKDGLDDFIIKQYEKARPVKDFFAKHLK